MIFIDFNNRASILYSGCLKAVLEEEKELYKKTKIVQIDSNKYGLILKSFVNYFISDIEDIKKKLSKYGEIVFCSDYNKKIYWRKQIFPDYKISRDKNKSNEFDNEAWKYFIEHKDMLKKIIVGLGFNSVSNVVSTFNDTKVSIEADDIIEVGCRKIGLHCIVSNDGDFYQILLGNPNVDIFHPILKKVISLSKKEIIHKNNINLLCGQKKDDIPSIYYQTSLSTQFIKWMKTEKKLEINDEMLNIIKDEKYKPYRDEFNELMKKMDDDLVKQGKRRKKVNVFNNRGLGKEGAEKLLKENSIEEILNMNALYRDNYKLNEKLYLLSKIPESIVTDINKAFENMKDKKVENVDMHLRKLGLDMMQIYKLKNLSKF